MNELPLPLVIGLGELLWDCFPDGKRPGGAPANFAFHANQLGCLGIVCSRVGQAELGAELVDFLASQGLQTRHLQFDPQFPTGSVTVELSSAGEPGYTIHESVAWDHLELTPDWRGLMASARAVCFGTLAQRSDESRHTIQHCLQATPPDCLRVFDINLRQQFYSVDVIRQSLELATILKLNADELNRIRDLLDTDGRTPQDVMRQLLTDFDLDLVCLTRGGDGCLLVSPSETVEIPGRPVKVVDPVGAGDSFTAGLISALLGGASLQQAGEFANRIGGLVAGSSGAMPVLAEEFAALNAELLGDQ